MSDYHDDSEMPPIIVGALPKPEEYRHRMLFKSAARGTVFGACSCGWNSGPCADETTFQSLFKGHK